MKQTLFPVRCLLLLVVVLAAYSVCTSAVAQPEPKPAASVELEARTFADPANEKNTLPYRFLTPGKIE